MRVQKGTTKFRDLFVLQCTANRPASVGFVYMLELTFCEYRMPTIQTTSAQCRHICDLLEAIHRANVEEGKPRESAHGGYVVSDEVQRHYDSLAAIFAELIKKDDLEELDTVYCEVLGVASPAARGRLNWFLDQFINASTRADNQKSEHTLTLGVAASADLVADPCTGTFLDVTPIADYISRELAVPANQVVVNASPFCPEQYFGGIASFLAGLARTKVLEEIEVFNAERPFLPLTGIEPDEECEVAMIFAVSLHLPSEQARQEVRQRLYEYQDRRFEELTTDDSDITVQMAYKINGSDAAPITVDVGMLLIDLPVTLLHNMLHIEFWEEFNKAVDDLVLDEFVQLRDDDGESRRSPGYRPDELGVNFSLIADDFDDRDGEAYGRFEIYHVNTKTVLYVGDGPREVEFAVFAEKMKNFAAQRDLGEIRQHMDVVYRADQGKYAALSVGV